LSLPDFYVVSEAKNQNKQARMVVNNTAKHEKSVSKKALFFFN